MYCVRWSQPNFAGMKSEQAAFGERFRQALKRRGLTQSASELAGLLASHGGVSVAPQAISAWLHGKSLPRPQNMRALARLLHVEPQELQTWAATGGPGPRRATRWTSTRSMPSWSCPRPSASWCAS